jgi:hypothetical protein
MTEVAGPRALMELLFLAMDTNRTFTFMKRKPDLKFQVAYCMN